MGLATGQLRIVFLSLFQSDLEFRIQLITQTRLQLSSSMNELVGIGTDLDPESPELKLLEQRKHKLELIDKQLDAAMQRYQTQLKSVETEKQSAKEMLQKNIQDSFSYGGGGGRG